MLLQLIKRNTIYDSRESNYLLVKSSKKLFY